MYSMDKQTSSNNLKMTANSATGTWEMTNIFNSSKMKEKSALYEEGLYKSDVCVCMCIIELNLLI